jgi:8-hydroxy-5-deazaflavin:NADPH oxidoreductase
VTNVKQQEWQMKIGILGAGSVGKTLGAAWAAKGHEVYVGARTPDAPDTIAWQQSQFATLTLTTLEKAARFGEVILVAIYPWTEIEKVLTPLATALKNKTILDVSNNINFDGQPQLAFTDRSMSEFVQSLLPESRVVKTLNFAPAHMMADPAKSGVIPSVSWVSGDDKQAKAAAVQLLKDIGWTEVFDLGGIHASLLQENVSLVLSLVVAEILASKKSA